MRSCSLSSEGLRQEAIERALVKSQIGTELQRNLHQFQAATVATSDQECNQALRGRNHKHRLIFPDLRRNFHGAISENLLKRVVRSGRLGGQKLPFSLSEAQLMMIDSARRLTFEKLNPILGGHAQSEPLPKAAMMDAYAALAEFGVTAMRLPEEHGGSGISAVDYGLILEQLPAPIALSLISHDGSTARLSAGASDALRQTYLPDLIAGRKIACTANTEQGAGSDSNAIRTSIKVRGDRATISGQKVWITNATVCDVMLVSCTMGNDDNGRPITRRVAVDMAQSDVRCREIPMTGLRQGHLCEVFFDDVEVPVENIIGHPGDAGKYMTLMWNGNRPLLGLIAIGLASQAFNMAREHCQRRSQFGRPLAGMQLVQQDLADIETAITSSRLMCLYALDQLDKGVRTNGIAAMAKRFATRQAMHAIDLSMQLLGALGVSEEMGVEQLWRDARVLQVPDGTMGILALIQGREITGKAAFDA
jgi:alkylation response protein AidB-like acyl-CoA dehydrogenase